VVPLDVPPAVVVPGDESLDVPVEVAVVAVEPESVELVVDDASVEEEPVELVAVPVTGGLERYLGWINSETSLQIV